ncbi:MAG TPA: HupE/UreJ family protein [Candidatus Baltobacteraceae bacterium]|nr:HupE/UreJ family protein [Candidatus Baltobacteraceae bacterium]
MRHLKSRSWSAPAAIAALWLASSPLAWAHIESGEAGGFASGFRHPWSGIDHIAAMIAVGLWGAQLGVPAVWLLPVTFPLVMAIGGFLGLVGIPLPGVEIGVGLSALLLGAMVAGEVKPRKLIWPAMLVGVFGLYHGHAHGTELAPGENGLLYSVGFVIATGLLHGCGIGIGLIGRWPTGQKIVRVAGATIAMAGAWFLWAAANPKPIESHVSAAKADAPAPGR